MNPAKSNDVHIVHASPQHVVKSHWTRTPWYEVEDSDEARTTMVAWEDGEWESIHAGLCEVSALIARMTDADVAGVAREVYSA